MSSFSTKKLVAVAVIITVVLSVFYITIVTRRNAQEYFFFQDSTFEVDTMSSLRKWDYTIWNSNPESYANITGGIAHLKYNESTGSQWGAAILYQGKYFHSQGQFGHILGGANEKTAEEREDGVTFRADNPLKTGQYFLNVSAMTVERTYLHSVDDDFGGVAKGNIGIELMASYTQRMPNGTVVEPDYDDLDTTHRSNIRISIVISSFNWSENKFMDYPEFEGDWYWDTGHYDNDYHMHLVRGKMENISQWYVFKIDMAEIIDTVFTVLNSETNSAGLTSCPAMIDTITIHGVQVYVEGIGILIEARIDYVQLTVE